MKKEKVVDREPVSSKVRMKAKPNWENVNIEDEETPDRLKIADHLIPEGMSFLWVTDSVYGQSMPQHRAKFERMGWTPVHQEDFDGQLDGLFMPAGVAGEIKSDGLVLMARPREMTEASRQKDRRKAAEQVRIKESALRSGDLPVTLDASHPTAVGYNRISKSYERISVPDPEK